MTERQVPNWQDYLGQIPARNVNAPYAAGTKTLGWEQMESGERMTMAQIAANKSMQADRLAADQSMQGERLAADRSMHLDDLGLSREKHADEMAIKQGYLAIDQKKAELDRLEQELLMAITRDERVYGSMSGGAVGNQATKWHELF